MSNNNENNKEEKSLINEDVRKMHEEVAAEREAKKKAKEEAKLRRKEAREERREARPKWAKIGIIVLQWCVVIGIFAWLGSYHGEELLAKIKGEPTYKQVVLDSYIDNSSVTVGEACKKFFGDYKDEYFETSDKLKVVEVSGKAYFMDKKVNIKLQFLVNSREVGDFSVYTSTVNDVPQNVLVTESIYKSICNSVLNVENVIPKDETTVSEEEADDNINYTFKTKANSKNINEENCVQEIKDAKVDGDRTMSECLNSFYDQVDWQFNSEENGNYIVEMYSESWDEMYRMKIIFSITNKGDISITNSYISSLDSTDSYPQSDEETNAILVQVFSHK